MVLSLVPLSFFCCVRFKTPICAIAHFTLPDLACPFFTLHTHIAGFHSVASLNDIWDPPPVMHTRKAHQPG
jgi:hypothetical protein